MQFEEREVIASDGSTRMAGFVICEECHGDVFKMFSLGPAKTSHLICVSCGMAYCESGCCGEVETA